MASPSTEVDEVRKALRGNGETIGALVMWSLDKVEVPRTRFESFFSSLGFDGVQLAPKVPSFTALLRRAASEAKSGLPDSVLLREASANKDRIVYACIQEQRNEAAASLTHSQTANVAVFRDWSVATNEPDNVAAKALVERFEFLRDTATSHDVSRALVSAITHRKAMDGICFTGRGGAYFIHPDHINVMRLIAHWVKEHGGPRTEVTIFEIGDSADNRSQAADKLHLAFSDRCTEIISELRTFVATAVVEKDEPMKPFIIDRREAQFKQLEKRVDSYSSVLGGMYAELTGQIKTAREEMYRLVNVDEALATDFGDE